MTQPVPLQTDTRRAVIQDWQPENEAFWQSHGKRIASRNLWISVFCLLLAVSVQREPY